MKTRLATLIVLGFISSACLGQPSATLSSASLNGADQSNSDGTNGIQLAQESVPNRRFLELRAQADLLNQLAREHSKRAEETGSEQSSRGEWEAGLAKEFRERAAALLVVLDRRKDQPTREPTNSLAAGSALAGQEGQNPDAVVFLDKLEERRAVVQQEIADALEAGRVYTAQLATNTGSPEFSRIALLVQENGKSVRQLQKELSDLELRKLEFRALHKQ